MAFETINLGTQPAGTGGDTARSAFEKTNRNFLAAEVLSAAMSQAQFEAIRAQNNEEFAASGFVHKGKHYNNGATYIPINDGLWTVTDSANLLALGKHDTPPPAGSSKTNYAVLNLAGVIFNLIAIGSTGNQCNIKFPQAPDGKTTYNKSTGAITTHATVTAAFNAQATDPTNVEVVTDRVDMWGFEAWLEEVNTTNPYIYPNGLIQSQATTMDGIATSASARPVTYYAVFEGDTGSKGKGLNFFALTDAQKKKVLANHKNNLYYLNDGRLVQWRLRQRTIAGAGNGDWAYFESSEQGGFTLQGSATSVNTRVLQQCSNNVVLTNYGIDFYAVTSNKDYNTDPQVGLFTSRYSVGLAPAYFLVCGTVNRLNQGAYHPSFNPSGSAGFQGTNTSCAYWYETSMPSVTNQTDCFTKVASTFKPSGALSRPDLARRPDKRFYDAIYADGQGGVCRDMRYSAYGIDTVDFAEADQKVKNGTYRGFEKILTSNNATFTEAVSSGGATIITNAQKAGHHVLADNAGLIIHNGFVYQVARHVNDFWVRINRFINGVATVGTYSSDIDFSKPFIFIPSVGNSVDEVSKASPLSGIKTVSVGGSFLQTDVVGNPVNILATPQLANGWQGSWIPEIPDGLKDYFTFTRKYIGSGTDVSRTYTSNNGSSWTTGMILVNAIPSNQSQFDNMPASYVTMYQYKAFARQTEKAVNAVVYGGNSGVGCVLATSDSFLPEQNRGVLLKESLTSGKRGIGGYTNGAVQGLNLTQFTLVADKLLSGRSAYDSVHPPILIDGNTSVDAVKALNYNVNINQQAFIQYAYTELKHNGTNWGDDGKVTIVDNQATKTDLNGNTVLVGTAKLKEPIGWIKNKV